MQRQRLVGRRMHFGWLKLMALDGDHDRSLLRGGAGGRRYNGGGAYMKTPNINLMTVSFARIVPPRIGL